MGTTVAADTEVVGAATVPVERAGDDAPVRYRPHLDGLRTIAVYLVVLFHAGIDRADGGFIGVDVFFVLSGYLVTQLLLRDLDRTHRLRFSRFYARRYRRLLPASFATLIITALVYTAVAAPTDVAHSVNAFKAAFLYVANWFFIHQSTNYFAADVNKSPVLHFWSLAIEEQFYLVWPILLAGIYALTRPLRAHRRRAMQGIVAVGAIASLGWALHLAGTNETRAYYGTDARAYQLLAGALLALSPGIFARVRRLPRAVAPSVAAAAIVGVLLLASSAIDMSVTHRGIAITVVTVVLLVSIEAARGGPANAALSCAPMTYLGRISYGTYLWHWPVILIIGLLVDITPISMFLVAALVATGLAALSYAILERPIREQRLLDRVNPGVIAFGLGLSLLGGLVVVPRIVDPFRSRAAVAGPAAASTGGTPVPKLDFAGVRFNFTGLEGVKFHPNCFGSAPSNCTIVHGSGKHIAVFGDSHAAMLFPTFAKIAQEHDMSLSTFWAGVCPWQRHFSLGPSAGPDQRTRRACDRIREDWYRRVIPQLKADVIVVVSRNYAGLHGDEVVDGKKVEDGDAGFAAALERDTRDSLQTLERGGATAVMVEPLPISNDDELACLSKAKWLEQCRFVDTDISKPIERMYAKVAHRDKHVRLMDLDPVVCPYYPICDPVVAGDIVRVDGQHIAPQYALHIVDQVTALLQRERVID